MKIVEPKKDGEFFIDGNTLTLITRGGAVGIYQTRDRIKTEDSANNKPQLTIISMNPDG